MSFSKTATPHRRPFLSLPPNQISENHYTHTQTLREKEKISHTDNETIYKVNAKLNAHSMF